MTSTSDVAGLCAELRGCITRSNGIDLRDPQLLRDAATLLQSQANALREAQESATISFRCGVAHQDRANALEAKLAAAESERDTLRARLKEAEKALQPFARTAAIYDPDPGEPNAISDRDRLWEADDLTVGHLRAARAFNQGGK